MRTFAPDRISLRPVPVLTGELVSLCWSQIDNGRDHAEEIGINKAELPLPVDPLPNLREKKMSTRSVAHGSTRDIVQVQNPDGIA